MLLGGYPTQSEALIAMAERHRRSPEVAAVLIQMAADAEVAELEQTFEVPC
jgi:hypothetical protein